MSDRVFDLHVVSQRTRWGFWLMVGGFAAVLLGCFLVLLSRVTHVAGGRDIFEFGTRACLPIGDSCHSVLRARRQLRTLSPCGRQCFRPARSGLSR